MSADRADGAHARELYREVASGEQAQQIFRIGRNTRAADETLAKLGYTRTAAPANAARPLRLAA